MKVVIGPYKSWVGPYQIAELLCFWAKPTKDEFGFKSKPEWVHDFGTWLAETKDGKDSWLTKLCLWIERKRQRQVYVRIDRYDTWSMDDTLAVIVLPMLKQLKATKHGAPHVDDFDTPQHLWSTHAKELKQEEWDTDSNWQARWDYVLDEMIWAFEQHCSPDEDDQFWQHCNDETLTFKEQLKRSKLDEPAYNEHHHRKQKGFQLFGKYYQALWD
jgi:hypothetical protein